MRGSGRAKWLFFFLLAGSVAALDVATKRWALAHLTPGRSRPFLGEVVPLTLTFNTGGLWGLGGGEVFRWLMVAASFFALGLLAFLYHRTGRRHPVRLAAIPLVAAGATGNLIDRLRWPGGVVDFIGPIDLGFMHWPIFNIADMAISCCTLVLVISLWREPSTPRSPSPGPPRGTPPPTAPA